MSTVSERQARRIGKQREKRQSSADYEVGYVRPPMSTYEAIRGDAPWIFGRDLPPSVNRQEIEDILSGLDAPIVDRRIAESKIERPWWRFW